VLLGGGEGGRGPVASASGRSLRGTREPRPVEEGEVDLDGGLDNPVLEQREHSRSIGSIIRSTISSSVTVALPVTVGARSAAASGSGVFSAALLLGL